MLTRKQWAERFDQFIYESFFDEYHGLGNLGVEAYEDYRNDLNDDDYMDLGGRFGKSIYDKTLSQKGQ